jgi:hypothetical protein
VKRSRTKDNKAEKTIIRKQRKLKRKEDKK